MPCASASCRVRLHAVAYMMQFYFLRRAADGAGRVGREKGFLLVGKKAEELIRLGVVIVVTSPEVPVVRRTLET
jgi:hypothetical protein